MRFWRVARVPSRQKAPSLGPEKSTASLDQEWRLLQLGCSPTCLMRRPGLLNRLNLSRLEGRHGRAEKNLTAPQSRKPTSIDWAVRKSVMATRTVPGSPSGTRGLAAGSNARRLQRSGQAHRLVPHSGLGDRAAVKIRYQFAWTARNVQCS